MYLLYVDLYNYFLDAVSISSRLSETGATPQFIIVGVANTNRYRDLLPLKSKTSGEGGGADNFLMFLEDELIPFIDKEYKTNDCRILAAPQASAVFSLYAFISKPKLFNAVISDNPFMNIDNSEFLFKRAEEFFQTTKILKNSFYIKFEKNERLQNSEYPQKFVKLLEVNKPDGFRFHSEFSEPSGYFISPLAFKEGLLTAFDSYKLPGNFQTNSINDIIKYYENLSNDYGFHVDPPSTTLTFAGVKLNREGKTEEAIGVFEHLLSLYPKSLNANWQLGETYRGLGNPEKAKEYYKNFLGIRDIDASMVYTRLRQVERMIDSSAAYQIEQEINKSGIEEGLKKYQAIKSDPKNKFYFDEKELNSLGYRLMKNGKIKEAIEIFKLNTELYTKSSNVYDSLGEAYLNADNRELAIQNFKKSLELNPENENARKKLEQLNK
jgi:tetratricopeptide (TPR) repeat protein